MTSIGHSVFVECFQLKSITIGETIQEIKSHAIETCTALETVTIHAATPPKAENEIFFNTQSTLKIKVPASSVESYKTANGWSDYAEQIVGIN